MNYDHWLGMQRNTSREGIIAFKREDWHWYDGTSFDFRYWAELEPHSKASCAVIAKNTGFWNDLLCTQLRQYICKTREWWSSFVFSNMVSLMDEN